MGYSGLGAPPTPQVLLGQCTLLFFQYLQRQRRACRTVLLQKKMHSMEMPFHLSMEVCSKVSLLELRSVSGNET